MHVKLKDSDKQRIADAVLLAEKNKESVQLELKMEGSFSSWLKTVETTGKLSFGNLFKAIFSDFLDLQNKIAAEKLGAALFGGSSGGGGGLLGGIFSWVLGGFSGGGGVDVGAVAGGYASGGDVAAGVPIMVGESGRELFVPQSAGYIVPNNALGGGGGTTVVNVSIDAKGAMPGMEDKIRAVVRQELVPAVSGAVKAAVTVSNMQVSTRLRDTGRGQL